MQDNHAYWLPLVSRLTVIDKPGLYRTRGGETVTITAVSTRHDYGCAGAYADGRPDHWHKSGRLYSTSTSANDVTAYVGPAP